MTNQTTNLVQASSLVLFHSTVQYKCCYRNVDQCRVCNRGLHNIRKPRQSMDTCGLVCLKPQYIYTCLPNVWDWEQLGEEMVWLKFWRAPCYLGQQLHPEWHGVTVSTQWCGSFRAVEELPGWVLRIYIFFFAFTRVLFSKCVQNNFRVANATLTLTLPYEYDFHVTWFAKEKLPLSPK